MTHGAGKLAVCFFGIFISYFYYGIVQEKITKTKYGEEKEPFVYIQELVFVQCVSNAIFSYFMIKVKRLGVDRTPWYYWSSCSFSYLAAMLASNWALEYVPYPTQVLGKSCKPIPIMIFGVLFAHKRYPLQKYLFILMIVLGVSLFLYKDKKTGSDSSPVQFGYGEALLCMSLAFDGTTGAIQDRIRASYIVKSDHMMLQMNLWSTLYLAIFQVVSGEIMKFFIFVHKYPSVLFDMFGFAASSALGQYFIFLTVTDFGPLTCSIITTTRKFFTILASVLYFQNPMNERQWLGTVFVFIGLCLDSIYGKTRAPKQQTT